MPRGPAAGREEFPTARRVPPGTGLPTPPRNPAHAPIRPLPGNPGKRNLAIVPIDFPAGPWHHERDGRSLAFTLFTVVATAQENGAIHFVEIWLHRRIFCR